MLAKVATRDPTKELEEVLLSTVSLLMYALEVVELPIIRSVIEAKVATRDPMKELEEVDLNEIKSTELKKEDEAMFRFV